MPVDLPAALPIPPAMVTEHVLGEDRLRQRGAVLAPEALADLVLFTPAARGVSLSGLPGTLVLVDGLRLTPAANGRVDLSLLPLAWLAGAELMAGPGGMARGAGSIGGTLNLQLAAADSDARAWMLAGAQAGRGIGGLDVRLGTGAGWISAGFTQGGALATPAGLAATEQGRWHLGARFAQDVAGISVSGRALLATRREAGVSADHHDLALQLAGGGDWRWTLALAGGGHVENRESSRMALVAAGLSHQTGLVLPQAAEPIGLAIGGEVRRLRLGVASAVSREAWGDVRVPLVQDRPAVESLVVELGWRQAWIAGRSEPLWKVRGRWEFFPGLALRGQVARGIDDLATISGIGRSIGLFAAPAFLPGFSLALDWRSQAAGPARVRALDASAYWRGRLSGTAQLTVEAQATRHQHLMATLLPVARFQSLLRARVEDGGWAVTAGWRHRSTLAVEPSRHWLDLGVERALSERIRLIASLGNLGDAGNAAGPVSRQALLQLVAGF